MNEIDIRALNLNLLIALEALLVEQNVSRAARRLYVSQSAMSHSLARLRDVLGDPLLVPMGRTLKLTPAARRIRDALPRALDGLGDALRATETFEASRSSRTFRVATYDYFEVVVLPDLLAYLDRAAPGVHIVLERLVAGHVDALAAGSIDLVLAGGELRVPAGVQRHPLFTDPFAVIVRSEHPSVRGKRVSLERYLELEHVLVSLEGRRQGVVDRTLASRGLRRNVTLTVPHFLSAPLAIRDSDRVCTLASTIAYRARELFGVRVLRPPLELPAPSVTLYWPASHAQDPASQWFRSIFVEGKVFSRRVRTLMQAQSASA